MYHLIMSQEDTQSLAEVLKKIRHHERDTGSMEYQITKLHFNIKELSEHVNKNKKDFSAQRAIVRWVQTMNKYKRYLKKTNPIKYPILISTLGMRR